MTFRTAPTVRLRKSLALVLALMFVLLEPSAQATPDGPAGPSGFQVVGGTWVAGSSGTLLGPAWWLDGPTASFGVTVRGPAGFSRHIGGPAQRFLGMPSTRSIHWCDSCNLLQPGGSWSATADDGSQPSSVVPFSIDQNSRLTPVVLSRQSLTTGVHTVSATWSAGADAASFIAYVQPQDSSSATEWTAGTILPADARSVTFTGLNLDPKVGYSIDVFGFSGDIASGVPPPVFNVASSRIDFLPGRPVSIGPRCYGWCCVSAMCPWHGPGPRILLLRGALTGTLSSAGKATLTINGKPAATLRSGRYRFSITDRDPNGRFILEATQKRRLTHLSGFRFVGRHSQLVTLTAGKWTFRGSSGEIHHFRVVA